VAGSACAFGLASSSGSWAQAIGTGTAAGISVADVAAIASLVIIACIAALVLMRRRVAAITGERDALADAIRNTRDSQLVARADGGVVTASAGWRNFAGYDPIAPLAHLANGTFVATDGELDRLRRSAAEGHSATTLLRSAERGGDCRRLHAEPLDRRPGYVVWSIDDGTILTESTHLAALTEDNSIGVYSVDQDGRFLYSDATFAGWLGLDPGDLVVVGTILRDVLDGDEGSLDVPLPSGRLTFKRPDGTTFNAQYAQTIVPARSGAGFHTRTLVRDVSAMPVDRDSAQADEPRFRQLFDESPVGIAMLDEIGHVVEGNGAFASLVGSESGAINGRSLVSLFAEDHRSGAEEWLGRVAAADGRLISHEAQSLAGETVLALYAGRFGNVSDNRVIVHVLGPSESRGMDAQLLQTQKMELVGQLAGGVAHDFNNLLTAMIGFCDLLLLRHNPKDPSFSDITQIKQNANRAASLVRQLLAFSRQQTLQPRVINLTDVLDELKHLLRRLMGANIEFDIIHGRDIGLVKADQGQLEQVVINLAVNARDAMPDGGSLKIRTGSLMKDDPEMARRPELGASDYVSIEVADTGSGIPRELLQKIYEPFFTTKAIGSGTGLGLATVYGIIKQTGGYIFVDSELDLGTVFTIYLPRFTQDAETVEDPVKEPEAELPRDLTGVGTVLLFEDEGPVRQFGARALRNKGYNVLEAENGENALELLRENSDDIDLLITDVMMPGMDGPSLIRKVRETHADLKVIFISGYAEDTFRKHVDGGAIVHFLPKPFSLQALAGKVKEVMSPGPS